MKKFVLSTLLAVVCFAVLSRGEDQAASWAVLAAWEYRAVPNIVYKRAGGFECRLDVIAARDTTPARPTLIYIHGGGWAQGSKEEAFPFLLPYLSKGMNVVNVEYRLAPEALAPAAVEDCRCALRWVHRNASEYGFDLNRLVVSGHSAGGHLSLMTGMLDPGAGFDKECPGDETLKVAAIVDIHGITDVGDLLHGVNQRDFAVRWLGALPGKEDLARRLSPLSYVRSGLPPVLIIHGDADQTVPYQQAVRLHEALDRAQVANQLLTIPGGIHGTGGRAEALKTYETIFSFLRRYGLLSQ